MKITERPPPANCEKNSGEPPAAAAFTLVELLVVIAIISILAAMLMPVLSRAKESGRRIGCLNNLRQLGIAVKIYTSEYGDQYPHRAYQKRWPQQTYDNYGRNVQILLCPSDGPSPVTWETDSNNYPADAAPRSYLINGFNDYYSETFGIPASDWPALQDAMVTNAASLKEQSVRNPSETVLLGEKQTSAGDYYMDIFEPSTTTAGSTVPGNDFAGIAEQCRHDSRGPGTQTGGSNYTMADGSARFIKFPNALSPLNLWCVGGDARTAYSISY
jgi:prepilin-type N-terminal cleavage/methylation domain-containing protein